ncbi:hypothetical protein [Actinoalloteichus hymeniacidonis]|uniref:Uncharacterized protein n=1 Tax=Actinoalloteichus hymeniacidonis TaxID=340345 RepID=A0AAC9HVA3_9PSEU|nr:hypothetical protein [Actinoalloteichus hymeniacidonis]AOS66108.1 hypothetical protein TL08_26700 [Actinoalloteichus hymeniacidonis]MBB5905788.1 hypothetical protein [Actinoalloteichus hymeniacidonis]
MKIKKLVPLLAIALVLYAVIAEPLWASDFVSMLLCWLETVGEAIATFIGGLVG